jgi:hypothetical protein
VTRLLYRSLFSRNNCRTVFVHSKRLYRCVSISTRSPIAPAVNYAATRTPICYLTESLRTDRLALLPHSNPVSNTRAMATTAADLSTPSTTLSASSPLSLASPFHTFQHTALKELPKFTGESEQNVTHLVDTVEHIGSLTA